MLPRVLPRAGGLTWLVAVGSFLLTPPAAAECPDYAAGPRWVGVADVSGSPDDIVIRGSYAYAAWGTGFAVFDLTNPIRPTLLGENHQADSDPALPGGGQLTEPTRGDRQADGRPSQARKHTSDANREISEAGYINAQRVRRGWMLPDGS